MESPSVDVKTNAVIQPQYNIVWAAQSGPQSWFVTCPVNDIFFGGARGGGKSDALIGDWLQHQERWGRHARGLLIRRTYTELEQLQKRCWEIFPKLGARWNTSGSREDSRAWIFPNGAVLKLRFLDRDADAENYQGHENCVAVGTPIYMADGRWKRIEDIKVGELVATLIGPRRVTATIKPYLASCVSAQVYDADGRHVSTQVHPEWHPVLHESGDFCAWSEGHRTGSTESADALQGNEPPHELSFPVMLHEQALRSTQRLSDSSPVSPIEFYSPCKSAPRSSGSGHTLPPACPDQQQSFSLFRSIQDYAVRWLTSVQSYALDAMRKVKGCLVYCPIASGFYGEHVPSWSGIFSEKTPSPDDVAKPCHDSRSGESGTTPIRTRQAQECWVHPYTGEVWRRSEGAVVGEVRLKKAGQALVTDLCVEDANHYISPGGLVNKNTWIGVDEGGNFPRPDGLDALRATLRSVHGVICRFVITGNPGGTGHEWLKARYITDGDGRKRAPCTPFVDEETKTQRVFIPSGIDDNKILLSRDPGYPERIRAATAGKPWLYRAWRYGDWDVSIDGTVFERAWFQKFWMQLPGDLTEFIISCDVTFKGNPDSDFVAMVVLARSRLRPAEIYLVDSVHDKMTFNETVSAFKSLAAKWPQAMRKIIEAAGNGEAMYDLLHKQIAGLDRYAPKASKLERAAATAAAAQAGNMILPDPGLPGYHWVNDYIQEHILFSGDPDDTDDWVDATSQGVLDMAQRDAPSRGVSIRVPRRGAAFGTGLRRRWR